MGIGFVDEKELGENTGLVVPKAAYGLSVRQMTTLGITGSEIQQRYGQPDEVRIPVQYYTLHNYQV